MPRRPRPSDRAAGARLAVRAIRAIRAANLLDARHAAGLSREALAHGAGIDRTSMSASERCQYAASVDKLEQLAKAPGIEAAALITRR